MKKILFLIFTLSVFVFSSCSSINQNYYIVLNICEDENFTLVNHLDNPGLDYIILKQNCIFDGEYFLFPSTKKEIDVISITSDNDNVIEIRSIDLNNKKFSLYTKNKGIAKITIKTKSFSSSTTIPIHIN